MSTWREDEDVELASPYGYMTVCDDDNATVEFLETCPRIKNGTLGVIQRRDRDGYANVCFKPEANKPGVFANVPAHWLRRPS